MIQIRIAGWAGQGVALAGSILAHAYAMYEFKQVVNTRSYTAAVRAGITYSDTIVDTQEVYELVITHPDVMLILYQKAIDQFLELVKISRYVIVEKALVSNMPDITGTVIRVPAYELAAHAGSPKLGNMVLLGALAQTTKLINIESLTKSVEELSPPKFKNTNKKLLAIGYDYLASA